MNKYEIYKRILKKPTNLRNPKFKTALIFLEEDFKNIPETEKITTTTSRKPYTLPKNIYNQLINDPIKYKVIEKFLLQDDIEKELYLIAINKDGTYTTKTRFSKKEIVEVLLDFIVQSNIDKPLTKENASKIRKLKTLTSFNEYLNREGQKLIECKTYRGEYKIKEADLISIISLPEDSLLSILDKNNIAGIPKAEFLECTNKLLKSSKLENNYIIPKYIYTNHELLRNNIDSTIVDFEEERKPFEKNIEVNDMLWEEIWQKTPKEFNKLEKAYYIYHELCNIFSYNEQEFVQDKKDNFSTHTIDKLKGFNKDNSDILCFEFTAIYSKFLEKIGLPYNIVSGPKYNGQHHAFIEFAYEDFYIEADSTKSLFTGDLIAAKSGNKEKKLKNFELVSSHSQTTNNRFEKELSRVLKYINQENQSSTNYIEKLKDLEIFANQDSPPHLEERLNELLNFIGEINLKPIDAMGYIHIAKKMLFNHEYSDNCEVTFIKDNNPPNKKSVGLCAIISYNPQSVKSAEDNEYYMYRPGLPITSTTKETILDKFQSNELNYIENNGYAHAKIPGIGKDIQRPRKH